MIKTKISKYYINMTLMTMMISLLLVSIGAFRDTSQHKTNGLYANAGNGHVIVTKNGYHLDGTLIEEGIGGVLFDLYMVTANGNLQIGDTLITDKDGKLHLSGLEVGDYFLEELDSPQGYQFEKDSLGNVINKFTFNISNDDMEAPVLLEIKNIKSDGAFTITKELVNSDGSDLEESQKEEKFEFQVMFGEKINNLEFEDDTEYSYRLDGGDSIVIKNGDIIELKTGETATFDYLASNTKYKVVEIEREGFYVSSINNEGVFVDNANVKFINTVASKGTGTIVIHKQVETLDGNNLPLEGNGKEFGFKINIDSNLSFPAKISGQNLIQIKNGDLVSLKDGQSITIFEIPYDVSYSIVENNYESDGYFAETQALEGNIGSNSLPIHHYFNNIYWGIDNRPNDNVNFNVNKEVINSNESNSKFEFLIKFDTEEEIKYQIDDGDLLIHSSESPIYIVNGETIIFINVPLGTRYSVKESVSDGFVSLINSVEGVVSLDDIRISIKNFHTGESIKDSTIKVSKKVIGKQTDKDFTFKLTLENTTQEFRLADGETKYFIVPVGTKYSISELDYSDYGYTTSISNGSGITKDFEQVNIEVTNTYDYRNEKVNLSGTKSWDVGEDGIHYLPKAIELDIYADGMLVSTHEVKADENGDWKYEVMMPKFSKDHKEIEYTVKERDVEYFESEVDGLNVKNTLTLPTNHEVKVSKKVIGDILDKEVLFNFTIEALSNAPIQSKSLVSIVGEGSANFPPIKFEKPGTYKYLVKEIKGSESGITYDSNSVIVNITIVRDGYQLKVASVEYLNIDGSSSQSALFTNTYKKEIIPENPEEPNEPEVPTEKPEKPGQPNGSGGGSTIGDLPHTGIAPSRFLTLGSISVLTGIFIILYRKNKQIGNVFRKEKKENEKK